MKPPFLPPKEEEEKEGQDPAASSSGRLNSTWGMVTQTLS
jgi:hypothetical protein